MLGWAGRKPEAGDGVPSSGGETGTDRWPELALVPRWRSQGGAEVGGPRVSHGQRREPGRKGDAGRGADRLSPGERRRPPGISHTSLFTSSDDS